MRLPVGLAVLALSFACACDSSDPDDATDYVGDPLAAIRSSCEFALTHKGCARQCILDALNINNHGGFVCAGSKDLYQQPDLDAYDTCTKSCPAVKDCAPYAGAFVSCACAQNCASQLSKRTQGMMAHRSDCYMQLPGCQ